MLDQFTQETGIEVEVRYDKTAAMAAQLIEEGDSSPADVFLAQDAGALGATAKEGVLTEMDEETLETVPEQYRDDEGRWVGLTGRVRVLAYNEDTVTQADLPVTVAELTEDEWKGRVGVAPTNASFQTFVTALRTVEGEDEVPELPVTPVAVPGDLWQLGAHRLICGDSTAADVVGRLLGDVRPCLLYTSPSPRD